MWILAKCTGYRTLEQGGIVRAPNPIVRLLIPAIVCLIASAASAAGFYVSKTGSDFSPGTEASPWRTIQKAADTIGPGDTAWVREGFIGSA